MSGADWHINSRDDVWAIEQRVKFNILYYTLSLCSHLELTNTLSAADRELEEFELCYVYHISNHSIEKNDWQVFGYSTMQI